MTEKGSLRVGSQISVLSTWMIAVLLTEVQRPGGRTGLVGGLVTSSLAEILGLRNLEPGGLQVGIGKL